MFSISACFHVHTVCPRSFDQFYAVSYYIKRVSLHGQTVCALKPYFNFVLYHVHDVVPQPDIVLVCAGDPGAGDHLAAGGRGKLPRLPGGRQYSHQGTG